jgi:formyltetrahydrofolate synthetase
MAIYLKLLAPIIGWMLKPFAPHSQHQQIRCKCCRGDQQVRDLDEINSLVVLKKDFLSRFATDTEAELNLVKDLCLKNGAFSAVVANHWAKGGAGATDLGNAVVEACAASREAGSPFR